MQEITNVYVMSNKIVDEAKEHGKKMRDEDAKEYPNGAYQSMYPYAFGFLSGQITNLLREIQRLQMLTEQQQTWLENKEIGSMLDD